MENKMSLDIDTKYIGNLSSEKTNKIFSNNHKILEYKKQIEEYKDNPQKVQELRAEIDKLSKENILVRRGMYDFENEMNNSINEQEAEKSPKDSNIKIDEAISKRKLNPEKVKRDFSDITSKIPKTIDRIWINENKNKMEIQLKDYKENKKRLVLSDKIEQILNNKKDIFKETGILEKCTEIAGSKFKGWLLMRKVNPVIVAPLGAIEAKRTIEEYLNCIYNKTTPNFDIIHDMNNSSLSLKNKILMNRYAKVEKNSLGANVFKGTNKVQLLETAKRKVIKNKPKMFKAAKHFSKAVTKGLGNVSKLAEKIRVSDDVKRNLDDVSKNYKEEVSDVRKSSPAIGEK